MILDSITKAEVQIHLYKNVKNVPEVREKILKGELKCCALKPSLIYSPFQIVVAANKAVCAEKTTTKSIYTEILYNLSITKNISKSLQTFGIHDKDTEIILVTINKIGEEEAIIGEQIHGEEVQLSELHKFSDINAIKKLYKITDRESNFTSLEDSIVNRIATKDFLLH